MNWTGFNSDLILIWSKLIIIFSAASSRGQEEERKERKREKEKERKREREKEREKSPEWLLWSTFLIS